MRPFTPADLAVPRGWCQCGCGTETQPYAETCPERNQVKGEPARFVRGHAGHARGSIPIDIDAETGCWNWTGKLHLNGYGGIRRDGRQWYAHRWVYERLVGPIPEGLQIDHLCRNHRCCNPAHLEPVVPAVNTRRGEAAVLTECQVTAMRTAWAAQRESGVTLRAFAREQAPKYGVAHSTIGHVLCGRSWTLIAEPETSGGARCGFAYPVTSPCRSVSTKQVPGTPAPEPAPFPPAARAQLQDVGPQLSLLDGMAA